MTPTSLLCPGLALIVSLIAYLAPGLFAPYRGAVVLLLAIIMFAMGLTLRLEDFARVLARPRAVW